jgi:hypothetical protein
VGEHLPVAVFPLSFNELLDFSTLDFVGLNLMFFGRDGYKNGYIVMATYGLTD